MATSRIGPIEYGVAALALSGQPESGDLHLVCGVDGGALVAVMDGLGHGPDAALAAREAVETIGRHSGESLASIVTRCHDGLRRTRGVVMGLANFDRRDGSVTWLGVGNIEGRLMRGVRGAGVRAAHLLQRPGVVGRTLPPLATETLPLAAGDLLIFATDGVRADFAAQVDTEKPPQRVADEILRRCGTGLDDALVLVARYVG